MYDLLIQNGNDLYLPTVIEEIVWENDWSVNCGKLTFSVLNTADINISEGNHIRFRVNDQNVFYGFIFTLDFNTETISVTAYDQRRYLLNKDFMKYKGITADALIRIIAEQLRLQVGVLANTGYVIGARIEDDVTLADMIQNALDITLRNSKKIFVLDDDFGKLVLKDVESMKLDLLLDGHALSDFKATSSIDRTTANRIKLVRDNSVTSKRDVYMAKDSSKENEWGILQHYEKLGDKENGPAKADALLKLYNQKSRGFTASSVIGDLSVRSGTSIIVRLQLGAMSISNYMIVTKVVHKFRDNEHLMDITLRGGSA